MTVEEEKRDAFYKWWEPCTAAGIPYTDIHKMSFYAGFRSAEKLDKIEVLEELLDGILVDELDKICIISRVEEMLSELKGNYDNQNTKV